MTMGTTAPVRLHSWVLSVVAVRPCAAKAGNPKITASAAPKTRCRVVPVGGSGMAPRVTPGESTRFHELGRRPLNHDRASKHARGWEGPERRFRAPRNRNRCGREQREDRERQAVVIAVDDQERRGKQECADRPG